MVTFISTTGYKSVGKSLKEMELWASRVPEKQAECWRNQQRNQQTPLENPLFVVPERQQLAGPVAEDVL